MRAFLYVNCSESDTFLSNSLASIDEKIVKNSNLLKTRILIV